MLPVPASFVPAIRAAAEGKTVREAAASVGMCLDSFYAYLESDKGAAEHYALARSKGYEALADDLLELPTKMADVAKATLLSNNIKWLLSKRKPQTYGDKLDVNVSGQVDLTAIMQESAQRLRPMRDPVTIEGACTPIESSTYVAQPDDTVSIQGGMSIDDLLA